MNPVHKILGHKVTKDKWCKNSIDNVAEQVCEKKKKEITAQVRHVRGGWDVTIEKNEL